MSIEIQHIHSVSTLNKADVLILIHPFYHILSGFNFSNGNESWAILVDSFGHHCCCLSISLGSDDSCFLLFFFHLDNKFSPFSILLCNLFGFDGLREFLRELQVSQRYIIKNKTEVVGPRLQLRSHIHRYFLSHSQKLTCIIIGYNRF